MKERDEVERNGDGKKWSKIGSVKSQGENKRSEYTYTDPVIGQQSSVNLYYRLKMMDNDGSFIYSNVVILTRNQKQETVNIFPNPAKDHITIQLPTSNLQPPIVIEVTDITGKVLLRRQSSVVSGQITLSTNKLANGTYTVKLMYNGEQYVQKVLVAK
jgi:hypothetical protein